MKPGNETTKRMYVNTLGKVISALAEQVLHSFTCKNRFKMMPHIKDIHVACSRLLVAGDKQKKVSSRWLGTSKEKGQARESTRED